MFHAPARRFTPPSCVLVAFAAWFAAGCGAERDNLADRVAEMGGYGPDVLTDEAVERYLVVESGGGRRAEVESVGKKLSRAADTRPDPYALDTVVDDLAAKARKFNGGKTAAEVYAEMVPLLDADGRLTAEQRAELKAALEAGMRAPDSSAD